ncbi:MAG: hypothetical protein COW00_07645 [Bdellovibrio sp. CG12_big_fil_rev_8_21_14_0_65_39_13]|nr:MAG: hypothetical protein COW78_12325 [Bdellovibrio sp. CG22_combo_CG10-13_8_21_14_all_39_27]PIQ60129.1 MAG: hypothetical protein COW00_07645 [Bdellovibrio sp. CG12_big_fil_rev_8_21_14_0_65_39_13]PIR36764.1 MAG: hypothetical protein COV37_01145 [Bdellovibrio sp. CG11_big_fil_rev_8_21_14_0_20_39_38]PJB52991.1 MAG: hypothetical protein CO099_09600 [Bdellovibrio sp. CG_4_9_14_3_um_filter_39_7]
MKLRFFFLALFALSCVGETKYVHYDNLPPQDEDNRVYPLSLLEVDKDIDVLIVIDNSGSMDSIQQNVIRNSRIFLEQFAKQPYINWKIGLISTDKSEAPYLGFDTSFDWGLIDFRDPTSFDRTVARFQEAVSSLGTNGDPSEYVFYNVKRVVDLYDGRQPSRPAFLRQNSHFVVIMISDEKEQSKEDFGAAYDAPNFFNTMSQYIAGNKILRFYGALNRKDLQGCTRPGDSDTYAGSQYESIINLSNGFNISACIDNFGTELAKIGKDIASLIGLPSLLLKQRPIVDTIKVFYKGKLLPPGRKDEGGLWFYEESTNTINFYTMEFVEDARNDVFKIEFEVDDGYSRD